MDEIKSALEIAMEKIEKLDEPTEEERLKWKYVPQGEELAARYLTKGGNLVAELGQYQENVKKYVIEGASEILIRNVSLPKNDVAKKNNKIPVDEIMYGGKDFLTYAQENQLRQAKLWQRLITDKFNRIDMTKELYREQYISMWNFDKEEMESSQKALEM